ncbi:MAG: ATP-binding protein [Caldilineaceae bacterium]
MQENASIQLTFPAQYQFLQILGSCIQALLASWDALPDVEQTSYSLRLAIHEICNNVIEHAYHEQPGEIKLILAANPQNRFFSADIYDTGVGFEVKNAPEPNLAQAQEEGYGLFLARQLMDEVCYTRQENQNHWRLVKQL